MEQSKKLRKSDCRFILALWAIHGSQRTPRGIAKYLNRDYNYVCTRMTGIKLMGVVRKLATRQGTYFTKPERGDVFLAVRDYFKVKIGVAANNFDEFIKRFKKENETNP